MEVAAGDENGGLAQGKNPSKEKDDLESTRAEIREIKQENERLRTSLAEMMKVYRSLQSQFSGNDNKQWNTTTTTTALDLQEGEGKGEELNLKMCLSLGASGSYHRRKKEEDDEKLGEGGLEFDLSHGCGEQKKGLNLMKNDSSFEELRKEEGDKEDEVDEKKEGWISRNILKKTRFGKEEEDDLIYNPVKKARVSIRARCDGIMMNDGCQWRKYGQKIAKTNPCPRSYYRCTSAQGCPVRKHVQRCADDMSILTTTYEGKHNHLLPPAATAIATTTSAAVDMFLSGSSNSKLGSTSMAPMIMDCSSINGMNFNVAGTNSRSNRPVFLSISESHPTITLDLTLPESSSNFTQLGRLSTNYKSPDPRCQPLQREELRYRPTTTTTTFSHPSLDSIISGYNSLGYNGRTDHHHRLYGNNKNPFLSLNLGGQQKLEQKFPIQSNLQKITSTTSPLTDTITEATKAIATDPSFQSALAATVATVLGGNGRRSIQESRGGGGDMLALGLKREGKQQQQHLSSVLPSYSSPSSSSTWMGRLMSHRDANWE